MSSIHQLTSFAIISLMSGYLLDVASYTLIILSVGKIREIGIVLLTIFQYVHMKGSQILFFFYIAVRPFNTEP